MNVLSLIRNRGLSISTCSRLSDVPYATLHDICSGKSKIEECSYSTLKRLADTLNVGIEKLVDGTADSLVSRDELDRIRAIGAIKNNYATSNIETVTVVEREFIDKPVFQKQLRDYAAPFLLYGYSEMFGDEEWEPNYELLGSMRSVAELYFNIVGCEIDSYGDISITDRTALTNQRLAKKASVETFKKIEKCFCAGEISLSEAYILVISTCFLIETLMKRVNNSIGFDSVTESMEGLFAFREYIYTIYKTAHSRNEFAKAVEDDRYIVFDIQDICNDIQIDLRAGIDEMQFLIPEDISTDGKALSSVYELYSSAKANRFESGYDLETINELYGINISSLSDTNTKNRSSFIEAFVYSLLYHAGYRYDECEVIVSSVDYKGSKRTATIKTTDNEYTLITQ